MKLKFYVSVLILLVATSCQSSAEERSNESIENESKSSKTELNIGDSDILLYVKAIIVGQFDKETKGTIVDETDGIIKTKNTVVIVHRNGLNEVVSFEIVSEKMPISPLLLTVNDMALNNLDNDLPIIKHFYIDEVAGRELSGGIIEDSPSENRLTYYYSPGDRYTKTITFAYDRIDNPIEELSN